MLSSSPLSPKKKAFLTGTLLLTGAGLACRVLGFFYRIFLSRTIGAGGLGLYHMLHPVFGICFALCAGSVQTALSQYIAAHRDQGRAIFRTGLLLSLALSLALAALISGNARLLSVYVLLEPRCAPYLPLMAVAVPFAALHACINGYYYGMEQSRIPACAQVAEQTIRMVLVWLLARAWIAQGRTITVLLAVAGHLIGEAGAAAFTLGCLWIFPPERKGKEGDGDKEPLGLGKGQSDAGLAGLGREQSDSGLTGLGREQSDVGLTGLGREQSDAGLARRGRDSDSVQPSSGRKRLGLDDGLPIGIKHSDGRQSFLYPAAPLLALALPLMGNRLILNLLAGAEAVWIPNCLHLSGLSVSDSIALYGVLTGMAMPFILFPSAITNSLAVLLLPSVARDQAEGRDHSIAASISLALRSSLYMGILCIGIFTVFGDTLGTGVFHDKNAGVFIQILAWLCPFLYLTTTLGSILNGLGHTRITFLQNAASLLVRLGFVVFGIPRFGILAYLWGMLASEILLALLHLRSLSRRIPFVWDAGDMIVRPVLFLILTIGIHYFTQSRFSGDPALPFLLDTAIQIGFFCFCYTGLLALSHQTTRFRGSSLFTPRDRRS